MRDMILFIFLFGVAICAFIAIYGNRKKTQSLRSRIQEPNFGNRVSRTNGSLDNGKNDFLSDDEFEMIDPVVETEKMLGKNLNKTSEYKVNFDSYKKSATPTAALEKENELEIGDEEKSEEEVDMEESQRAQKFFSHDLINIMVMAAPDKPFTGYELLQALLSAGLRFGKMNIFHRYENLNANTNGHTLFSLASAVKPGVFEMSKMGAFSSPALVLFMSVSSQKDVMNTFDLMINTAHQLVEDLGGAVCDARRELLSEEKVSEIQLKIAEYEKSKNTSEMFA